MFICLPLTLSFSHNCVWTKGSFSIGLAATGGQRKRDRESKQWGGLADAPCYFSSISHWLCQQWLSLSRASKLRAWQHAPCSYQRELITGTLIVDRSKRRWGSFHHCIATFSPLNVSFFSWLRSKCACFFPFPPPFILFTGVDYRPNPLESNPRSLLGSN